MKRIINICIVIFSITSFAQQGINYKAILKDSNGNVMTNTSIDVEFYILQGVAQTVVYEESHTTTTDANGIFILNIGEGSPEGGSLFNAIDWASDEHFLNVQIDVGGNLIDFGTTSFQKVPYAFHANTATTVLNGVANINDLSDGKSDGSSLFLGVDAGASDDGTDNKNVGIGYHSLQNNVTGTGNVALGYNAGLNETNSNKLYISNSDTSTPLIYGEFDTKKLTINGGLGINTNQMIGAADFTIRSFGSFFGGMFIDSPNTNGDGKPFYGYALNQDISLFHYYDAVDDRFKFQFNDNFIPTLSFSKNGEFLLNGAETINSSTDFTLRSKNLIGFGGMYIDSPDSSTGLPFYGYAINGVSKAFHYYQASDDTWRVNNNSIDGLILTSTGYLTVAGGLEVIGDTTINGKHSINSNGDALIVAAGTDNNDDGIIVTTNGGDGIKVLSSGDDGIEINNSGNDGLQIVGANARGIYVSESDGIGVSISNPGSQGLLVTGSNSTGIVVGSSEASGILIINSAEDGAFINNSSRNGLVIDNSTFNGVKINGSGTYGGFFEGNTSGVHCVSSNDNNPDVILGGRSNSTTGDNGIIASDPIYDSSDILLRSNDAVVIQLDVDTDETGEFQVRNGLSSVVFEVEDSGDATLTGSLTQNSDRRLKKDITDLHYGLKEILQLEPKAYNWKNKEQRKKSLGLIAQEVQPIIREIVNTQDNETKTLGISYSELIPVLINAIKEQQQIIDTQKQSLKSEKHINKKQSEQFEALLRRVEAIENRQSN